MAGARSRHTRLDGDGASAPRARAAHQNVNRPQESEPDVHGEEGVLDAFHADSREQDRATQLRGAGDILFEMRWLLAISVFAACASADRRGTTPTPSAGSDDDKICRDVTDTGTLISRYACVSKEDANSSETVPSAGSGVRRNSQTATCNECQARLG